MAYLAGIIISLIICFFKGWYSIGILTGATLTAIGLVIKRPWLAALALSITITSFYSAAAIGQDIQAVMCWLVCIYIGRAAVQENTPKWLIYATIPVALCCLLFIVTDRNMLFFILLPVLANCLPIRSRINKPKGYSRICLWLLTIYLLAFSAYYNSTKKGRTAYISNGEWAKTDKEYTLAGLDIATSYSYSEFLKLIRAHVVVPSDLTNEDCIAWLITPTRPFTKNETAKINAWVNSGGHLIAVTDHTDLFGHGRTLNKLLQGFDMRSTFTASISADTRDPITYSNGKKFSILTGNAALGKGIWPEATLLGYMEDSYYGRPNFFGPMTPAGNTPYGRWIIMGKKTIGKGTVTIITDSTIFSNFAVYQPGTEGLINRAQRTGLIIAIFKIIPYIMLLACIIAALNPSPSTIPVCLIGFSTLINNPTPKLNWHQATTWAGDATLVLYQKNTRESFTTAYSIAALSGQKPHWRDNISNKVKPGVWISKTPPPTKEWKWISPQKNTRAEEIIRNKEWDELLTQLQTEPVLGWQTTNLQQNIQAGSIWTDDRMGNWWFDRGLSPARQERFQAFLNWLDSKPVAPNPIPSNSKGVSKYNLKIFGDEKTIAINCPNLEQAGTPVLIGDGISAQLIKIDGKNAIISVASWMEYWRSPRIWMATEK